MSDASNLDSSQNHDAQLASEEIAEGVSKAQNVNVEADYEASKQFSVSELDKQGGGAGAAEAATAPKFELHEPEEPTHESKQTGNPEDFKQAAKEIAPNPGGTGNVSDDLVRKAMDMGKPGE